MLNYDILNSAPIVTITFENKSECVQLYKHLITQKWPAHPVFNGYVSKTNAHNALRDYPVAVVFVNGVYDGYIVGRPVNNSKYVAFSELLRTPIIIDSLDLSCLLEGEL